MSNLTIILQIISVLVSMSIGAYAAVWAFKIRQALFVEAYRNQALGIGMLALLLVAFEAYGGLLEIPFPFLFAYAPLFVWVVTPVLFYWVNTSVVAGRRTDPFRRDTAHWLNLRIIILSLISIGIISNILLIVFSPQLYNPKTPPLLALWLFSPIFITTGVGAVVLPIVARRSRDRSLRKHLEWFGLFSIVLIAGTLFAVVTFRNIAIANVIGLPAILAAAGYCLYKSVKYLAPLNLLPSDRKLQKTSRS